jgi:PleD family two-component response regulator
MSNVGILIVDGDAAGRAAVQQVLSCEDWRIGAAHDAGQALQELATGNWTLVVANTATIGIDGTLYLTLKELAFAPLEPGKTRLRVLLVVPEEDAANVQPALERDAMPYTLRPFHFHDFLEKVSDLLMETEAIGAPIRRVRQEGKTSGDAYAQRGAQKAGRSTGMFANRDDYSMTEEEIAAYEQEQLFELQRKRKKKPQEHLG